MDGIGWVICFFQIIYVDKNDLTAQLFERCWTAKSFLYNHVEAYLT